MSKLTIYLALAQSGLWWAVAVAVFTSVLTMVALMRPFYRVFWAVPAVAGAREAPVREKPVREVPAFMWAPMVVLAALCLLLGLAPGLAYGLLHQAAALLAGVGG